MTAAGYNVVYKGKWHCSKPAKNEDAEPSDLEKYGFTRWNPPDAGANQTSPRPAAASSTTTGASWNRSATRPTAPRA